MIAPIDQQLILEMLRRMKILAGWLFSITSTLDAIVAGRHTAILHLDIGRRMSKLALVVGPGALVPLELAAHLQLQPSRVLLIDEITHV